MKESFLISMMISISMIACSGSMSAPSHDQVSILTDVGSPWIVSHASNELASYLSKIKPESEFSIGTKLDSPQARNANVLFVIAVSGKSPILDTVIKDTGWTPSKKAMKTAESFVIRCLKLGSQPVVVIIGSDGKGALNGVYHYIEHVCGAGFFPDGEQIPRLAKLPITNIDIVEAPRFKYRANLPLNWGIGLRDYFCRMWTLEDWQKHIDWMAKKKLNVLTLYIEAVDKFWGDTFVDAFPEVKQVGYPLKDDTRMYPPDYRTKLMKQVYAYARERGIRFEPVFFWGAVEQSFKLAHPELKYVKGTYASDNWYISAEQPECAKTMEKLWRAFIKEFGTDHLYRLDLIMESAPTGMDSREMYRQARSVIRKLDPKAEVISHWNYAWTGGMASCTFQESAQDIAQSKDDVTVEDWVDMQSTIQDASKVLDDANVKRWISVYWNTGWDVDKYLGLNDQLIALVHREGSNPHYTGMYAASGDLATTLNPFRADMMCEMSWRPERVQSALSFSRDYALRRHGSVAGRDQGVLDSYKKMLEGTEAYMRKDWLEVKGQPLAGNYGWLPANLWTPMNRVVSSDTRDSIKLFDEALAILPQYGSVGEAPFIADHHYRLNQVRLFESVELGYIEALTLKDKAECLAAIDSAIDAANAHRWLLESHGKRSIAGSLRSLRQEGLPVEEIASNPAQWVWLAGYDSIETLDAIRLPKLIETRKLISEDKPVDAPWLPK